MKKILSAAMAAVLLVTLAGCSGRSSSAQPAQSGAEPSQGVEPAQTQSAAAQPAQAPTIPAPTVPAPTAENSRELEFVQEGKTVTATAKLHQGQGYSLYVLEDWYLETEYDDGFLTETWEGRPDAELEVRHLGKMTLEEAEKRMKWEEDDFSFTQDDQGHLIGDDREREDGLEIWLLQNEAGEVYALSLSYSLRFPGGWDNALRAMAETFQLEGGETV